MSCGQKAYYEDLESDIWESRKQKLKDMSEKDLLNLFDMIKNTVDSLHKETPTASRYQFSLLDRLKVECKKLP